MLDLLRAFRMMFLLGRLAVFGLAVLAATVATVVHRVSDALHYRAVEARVDRLMVTCRTPGGEADCGMLAAMGDKGSDDAERRTTVWLRYFSPADGREHRAAVERDGDLTGSVRAGGAMTIRANTIVAEKVR